MSLLQNKQRGGTDDLYTPTKAIAPILKYLPREWIYWECAAGKSDIVNYLRENRRQVDGTDIKDGEDFLTWQPKVWDCIVTNPPYSIKNQFLQRAYSLGKPFAMLLPITALETSFRQKLYTKYGLQVIFLDKRIDFIPEKKSSSWFATAWFTWKLDLPSQMVFEKV